MLFVEMNRSVNDKGLLLRENMSGNWDKRLVQAKSSVIVITKDLLLVISSSLVPVKSAGIAVDNGKPQTDNGDKIHCFGD